MELKIKQIENGYLMEWQEETEENKFITCQEAIVNDDDDTSDDDKESMEKLLYYVAEFFGCNYDKWSENNLKISWNKKGKNAE